MLAAVSRRLHRVVFVSHSAGLSGAERALLRLGEALPRDRVDPVVLLPEDGPLRPKLEELRIPVRIRPSRWWIPATHWSARTFLDQLEGLAERCDAMTRELEALRPDIVHTNTVVSLEGAVAAARTGLPHVWHSRGLFGNGFPPPFLDDVPFFYRFIDRLADRIVCVSRAVEREASRHGGLTERVVVADGYDVGPLLRQAVESRAALATRLGLDGPLRLVVALGGVQRRKGQRDLVEAAALLTAEFPDLVVVLGGHVADAEYGAELEDLIHARGLERVVRFIGFQPEVHSLLAHAELFVHPSLSEGFALAVLEAMAAGAPVVATRSGGPEEIVEDGRNGLLVEPAAPADLARAMRRLLTEPSLAARFRREGPARATRFSPAVGAGRVVEIYEGLTPIGAAARRDRSTFAEEACAEVLARARLAAGRPAP